MVVQSREEQLDAGVGHDRPEDLVEIRLERSQSDEPDRVDQMAGDR